MKNEKKYVDKILDLWSVVASNGSKTPEISEISDMKNSLLHSSFFQVGDSFYTIYNVSEEKFEDISPSMTSILGYQTDQFTIEDFISIIHPDDFSYFADCQKTCSSFFTNLSPHKMKRFKIQYDLRLKKKQGEYLRFLLQCFIIQTGQDGKMLRLLTLYTDISQFKTSNKISLSFIGFDGETSYHDVPLMESNFVKSTNPLTKRETEILRLIIRGENSSEISEALRISRFTVDTHRKNILSKTGCSSTGGLIIKTLNEGWV